MQEAIRYYQRKLDKANDLMGISYVCKLIQLEHQPTIDKTLDGLKQVQYPRHFPNHLVVQLARLNRPHINDSLIEYFKMHFKATKTEWHAISALQDDRVVETVVEAINQYEKSYFSRKVISRCIHLLGRIGSHSAYMALRDIIDAYFQTDNRFIDNYELPLASDALNALRHINLPEAKTYFATAEAIYQQRIEAELAHYPERLSGERTDIGITLHEGSALGRMKQYALPTLIQWHQYHTHTRVRQIALDTLLDSLKGLAKLRDERVTQAIHYVLTCYDDLRENDTLRTMLHIVEHVNDPQVVDFARRAFDDDIATSLALTVLANRQAESIFEQVVQRLHVTENMYNATRSNIAKLKAYIHYFGQIDTEASQAVLIDLYNRDLKYLHIAIAEAMLLHARERDSAMNFLNHIIEHNKDLYTVKQTILMLGHVGKRSFLTLLSLLERNGHRTPYAVEALGFSRNSTAIPYLMHLLLDTDPASDLAETALKSLERIGTEASFAALNAWEETYG